MVSNQDPTETYLQRLLAGDRVALLASFSGAPTIDDPFGGQVRSAADFERFAGERQAWLAERAARLEPLRTTRTDRRTVFEALLHLRLPERAAELPVGVVGEQATDGRLRAIRVYHSLWPLFGSHRVRPPLLPLDPTQHVTDVIAEYQQALATGDIEAIVGTFEPDGYFREPAGGEYIYHGREKLHEFMAHLLGTGGIRLEHCAVTDDGVACAIEFNAVQFGPQRLTPQAGMAVYERGPSGRLHAARIYDDVNVEALAGSGGTSHA
jgi:hypothetical protein